MSHRLDLEKHTPRGDSVTGWFGLIEALLLFEHDPSLRILVLGCRRLRSWLCWFETHLKDLTEPKLKSLMSCKVCYPAVRGHKW